MTPDEELAECAEPKDLVVGQFHCIQAVRHA